MGLPNFSEDSMKRASDIQQTMRCIPAGARRAAQDGVTGSSGGGDMEAGYQAATMTGIAERMQASIGTIYEDFLNCEYLLNKEAVAKALRTQYGDE